MWYGHWLCQGHDTNRKWNVSTRDAKATRALATFSLFYTATATRIAKTTRTAKAIKAWRHFLA